MSSRRTHVSLIQVRRCKVCTHLLLLFALRKWKKELPYSGGYPGSACNSKEEKGYGHPIVACQDRRSSVIVKKESSAKWPLASWPLSG